MLNILSLYINLNLIYLVYNKFSLVLINTILTLCCNFVKSLYTILNSLLLKLVVL